MLVSLSEWLSLISRFLCTLDCVFREVTDAMAEPRPDGGTTSDG